MITLPRAAYAVPEGSSFSGFFAFDLKITTIVAILRTIGIPVDPTVHRFHTQSLPTPGIGAVITAPGRAIPGTETGVVDGDIGGFPSPRIK